MLLGTWSLTLREVVRFLRQRSRVMGALVQPILFWLMIGLGLSGSFRAGGSEGQSSIEFFVPGIAAMIVMFTSIFSAISVIQDRKEGFLQGVLVAPVSRTSIVLGKLLGGATIAVGQAIIFLLIAWICKMIGIAPGMSFPTSPLTWLAIIGMFALMGIALCGLGYAFAWRMESVQGFHAIMSLVLFPMWLLSGAIFPSQPGSWFTWITYCNPLTYAVAGVRHLMIEDSARLAGDPSLGVCVAVTFLFAASFLALDVLMTRRGGPV